MKFKLLAGFLLIALIGFGVGNAHAIDLTKYWRAWPGNNLFTGDVAFYDGATFEIAGAQIYTVQDATITSPATTFDVTDLFYISLTSDQNVTGVHPTGGVENQVIVITPGAGSNTIRFDSGTTVTLHGENITLTEGTTDTLTLICIDATTPRWKILDPIGSMINAVANNSTDETVYPTFLDGATGAQQIETDTGFTYNPNTGIVTAAGFAGAFTGALTGNADTASYASSAGNATNVTATNDATTTEAYVAFFDGASGSQGPATNVELRFDGSTGAFRAKSLNINGTAVTATAAELNLVDGFTLIQAGQLSIANGSTSNTATVMGLLPEAYVVATFGEAPTAATHCWAVPSTDSLKIDINADNTADLKINYVILQK